VGEDHGEEDMHLQKDHHAWKAVAAGQVASFVAGDFLDVVDRVDSL
jgi:hypothetical protein